MSYVAQGLNALLTIIFVFVLVKISTDILMSYSNPHAPFVQAAAFRSSLELVDCATRTMPLISWYKIEKCIKTTELYNVSNGHVPYFRGSLPVAYVVMFAPHSVFATKFYQQLDTVSQALVLIHECAHLALKVDDIAYHWQLQFQKLTMKEHLNNADSYLHAVKVRCTDIT